MSENTPLPIVEEDDWYRDHLATVDEHGKRVWIYPKKPKGKFTNYRTIVSVILLVVLFGMPWIRVH
ncbi:MAG: cytochrome c oxidase accessory protein CcoG, partial [Saprospiraceae bacterium]|nr:cytochrome c oxidase accessory protein CcoG [Saprospiraceae bacterium]